MDAVLNASGDIFLTNRWWLGVGKGYAIKFREQSGRFVSQEPRSDRGGVLCSCKGTSLIPTVTMRPLQRRSLITVFRASYVRTNAIRSALLLSISLKERERERQSRSDLAMTKERSLLITGDLKLFFDGNYALYALTRIIELFLMGLFNDK